MARKNKINVLEVASSILKSDDKSSLEVVDVQSKIKLDDYSQEDMMKLLITKIKGVCYNSECLASKAKTI